MAPRRNSTPKAHINIELTGFALCAFAILLGMVMMTASHRAGIISFIVTTPLVWLFGRLAGGVPVIIGLIGAICFLEVVTETGQILFLCLAGLIYQLLLVTGFGSGYVGEGLNYIFTRVVGNLLGPVLILIALMLTEALTKISMKKVLGHGWHFMKNMKNTISLPRLKPLHFDIPPVPQMPKRQKVSRSSTPEVSPPSRRTPTVTGETSELPAVLQSPPFSPPPSREAYAPPRRDGPTALPGAVREMSAGSRSDIPVELRPRRVTSMHEEIQWEVHDGVVEEYIVLDEASKKRTYRLPPLVLFDEPVAQVADDGDRKRQLIETLASFGVGVDIDTFERGPSITRYELKPHKKVKIAQIKALGDDLALALAAVSVRIEAPIPGKSAVGIEVPNAVVSIVKIREILDSMPSHGLALPMALGKDITGQPVYSDLARMPHLLVAGATGAGKSVCLNNIIATLLAFKTPDEVQMLMIDPKRVELTVYNGIPHLVKEVITDARMAAGALFEMTKEMDSRYERFAKASVRKIEEYNEKFPEETLPHVVIIIDELADLMLVAPAKVETTICRLAQLARATGIHLIVATQRPSVDVITGIIKANIPSRIAFAVSSQIDSRTILDMGGAERLLGRGDMLYLPIDAPKPRRAQGAFITGDEVTKLVAFWAQQARPKNLVEVEVVPIDEESEEGKGLDPLSFDAAQFIIETNYASTAQLQSQFQIGHPRAVRLMKGLEEMKVVGPHEGTKPRKILLGLADLELMAPRFGKKPEPYLDGTMPDEFGS